MSKNEILALRSLLPSVECARPQKRSPDTECTPSVSCLS